MALVDGVRRHGLDLLPWPDSAVRLRQRAAFARAHEPGLPAIDDPALLTRLDEWLCDTGADRVSFYSRHGGGIREFAI